LSAEVLFLRKQLAFYRERQISPRRLTAAARFSLLLWSRFFQNPTWGEERVAAALSVKLGILVSPRTVRAYWPQDVDPMGRRRISSQHWRSFVRNHAQAIVATDFLVAITAGFRELYVLVVMEIGSRRILHL